MTHTTLLLDSMEMAMRYGVSYGTFIQWQRFHNFPLTAKHKDGHYTVWDAEAVDRWLASRPKHPRQRPTRWGQKVEAFVEKWDAGEVAA